MRAGERLENVIASSTKGVRRPAPSSRCCHTHDEYTKSARQGLGRKRYEVTMKNVTWMEQIGQAHLKNGMAAPVTMRVHAPAARR
jgi:hypothetical protein